MDDANYIKQLILDSFPTISKIVVNYIGPVIGSHSGLGTLAVFYLGNDRTND